MANGLSFDIPEWGTDARAPLLYRACPGTAEGLKQMSQAGVVSRSRQLCGDVVARLHSHGIEVVPFITVGCLVVGFWCVLSLPAIVQALNLRAEHKSATAVRSSVQPRVHFRVIASSGGATMPELRRLQSSQRPTKRSRDRRSTRGPATAFTAAR